MVRSPPNQGKGEGANVSSINFSAGRGSSGVENRWHHPREFKALSSEHEEELSESRASAAN